jgi:hypothetical protein
MEEKLITFIRHEFLEDPDMELDANTKLISSGLVDSSRWFHCKPISKKSLAR